LQSGIEWRHDILAFDAFNVETFCPTLQHSVVDVLLRSWVRKCEAKRQFIQFLALVVVIDKLLKTVGDISPQLIRSPRLELLRHLVFRLNDIELAFGFWQVDLTDSQIRSSHIKREEGALLVAGWVAHNPCRVHRNAATLLGQSFSQLGDEVISDGLQFRSVHNEHLFQTLDLLQQVLWHICHRALAARRPLWTESDHCVVWWL